MVALPPSTSRFYVPWKDISEGTGNIFAQQFSKNHTIATHFYMRVTPQTVYKVFSDIILHTVYAQLQKVKSSQIVYSQ